MAMDPREKKLRQDTRQWWNTLDQSSQQQFNDLVAEQGLSKPRIEREKVRIYIKVESGESFSDILDQRRLRAAKQAANEEERERQRLDMQAAYQEKRRLAMEALSRGEPIPSHYRPQGGNCFCCKRPLRDPVSVRWGIGPDCMATLELVGGNFTPQMVEQAKKIYKAEYQDQQKKALPIA
jgi:hypothetical protein